MMKESTKIKWEDNQRIQTRLSRHKSLKNTLYLSLFIGYGVFYYNRKSYSSLIPALLQSRYLGESELGFISSCFAFSYGLSKFGSGILSDKLQPRELFVIGLIATGICNIFFTFIDGVMFLSCVWLVNSLLTDVVVLTPSDEILPSAYPSCIFDSLCFSRANHLAVFKNIRANWKPPYILRD